MGLSTKQVSSDDHGWNQALLQASTLELANPTSMKKQSSQQQQQQQGEPLKCPRCDSTNTKFCYYNNYNKSQPRHFCKACKRHWTKGGTLRNVPVGGGRKNKRKASNAAAKSASKVSPMITPTTTTTTFSEISNTHLTRQAHQPMLTLPIQTLKGINEKNFSEAFYQTLGRQPSCSMPDSDLTLYKKSFSENNGGIFLGSTLNLFQNDQDLQFPYSNLGSFESNPNPNPCSISSIQSPNLYNYTGEVNALEETVMNSTNMAMSSSSMSDHQQPWQISNITNGVMDMASNWGWDDFDKFVSVDADLGVTWDESEIKP